MRVEVRELPGVKTPTQKPGAFVEALTHSAKGLLLSSWVVCDFRVVLSFTAWNASDLCPIPEVIQSQGNILPIIHLQQKSVWTRLTCRMAPSAPEPFTIWKSTREWLQSETICCVGAEGLITAWSVHGGLSLFRFYWYFAFFLSLWDILSHLFTECFIFYLILSFFSFFLFFFYLCLPEKFIEITYSCILKKKRYHKSSNPLQWPGMAAETGTSRHYTYSKADF